MSTDTGAVWNLLREAGLVSGQAPDIVELESPWYVKVLLGFSGWFAALFLLGFIGVGFQFIMDSGAASFITGMIMISAAFAILSMAKNEFFEHLALAVSLAGQVLVTMAMFDLTGKNDTAAWIMTGMMQGLLAVMMPSFVHRVFSSWAAAFALAMGLAQSGMPHLFSGVVMFVAAWLWLNEFRYPQLVRTIQAIAYGQVLALIQLKGTALFANYNLNWLLGRRQSEVHIQAWMGEVLVGAVLLYVVWTLLQRYGQHSGRVMGVVMTGTLLLCAVSMEASGISVGVAIMLLGFSAGNRILMGLGIASLLFYLSSYYYLLDTTLLVKSQILFVVGVLLLLVRWLVLHVMQEHKEIQDAK